jgi:hypothetical protein
MKKLLSVLFLVSLFTFVGCGEKTTGEKVDSAIESGKTEAGAAEAEAGKALDEIKK